MRAEKAVDDVVRDLSKEKDTCGARINKHYQGRLEDLRAFQNCGFDEYKNSDGDMERFNEYGLCFDYVASGTFTDQRKGYFRYQLSWGGPGDEFRFYVDETFTPYKIEYWFFDWFDGAHKTLSGKSFVLLCEVFQWFRDVESVQSEYDRAMAE